MIKFTRIASIFTICFFSLISCTKDDDFIENKKPTVDAGPSKTFILPGSETLTGTATDEDGKVVAYLWSQVSGPSATTIVTPGSASTLIKGFVEGNYVFQLMATDDKGATGVDTATVVVKPAPEQTITLTPMNNFDYKISNLNGQDESHNTSPDLVLAAWTRNSLPYTVRSLFKFDLSNIPSTATIVSANLYLYSYPPPLLNGDVNNANSGTNNSFTVQQVTSNWSSTGVTWFNQPAITTSNQVVVPTTNQSSLDLNLDVKNMVSSMVSGSSNYGFLLKLQSETIYTSRIFVSSNNTTYTTKHPKLVVVYK